jgi:hypothetical protein
MVKYAFHLTGGKQSIFGHPWVVSKTMLYYQLEGWFVKNRFLGIDFNVCFLMIVKVKCSIIKGTSNNTTCSIH